MSIGRTCEYRKAKARVSAFPHLRKFDSQSKLFRLVYQLKYQRRLLNSAAGEIFGYLMAAVCVLAAFSTTVDLGPAAAQTARGGSARSSEEITATNRVFALDSFWYKPVPADAPLHPNSANFVTDFLRQKKAFYGTVAISTADYSSPIYVVGDDVPSIQVDQWDCHNSGYQDEQLVQQWRAVPIPPYAQPANGTDGEMTIYQPTTDTMWEFWRARKRRDQWQACWGGRMQNVSKSDGIWAPHYGTTATGLPFLGGQITVDELRRGKIDHVIGIAMVETENWDIYSWPANRSDGWNPSHAPDRIPEGLRFRLDPSVDVDALRMHPIGKIIAKAAQIYGFVVWDRAGAIGIRAENPKRFTALGKPDPYPALWNGTASYAILAGFPWDKLQFLPMDYGKP
jgi:hypothetical protein